MASKSFTEIDIFVAISDVPDLGQQKVVYTSYFVQFYKQMYALDHLNLKLKYSLLKIY